MLAFYCYCITYVIWKSQFLYKLLTSYVAIWYHLCIHTYLISRDRAELAGIEAINVYQPCKNTIANLLQGAIGYTKLVYPILVKNSVQVYHISLLALLPQHDKLLVKEQSHDPTNGLLVSFKVSNLFNGSRTEYKLC